MSRRRHGSALVLSLAIAAGAPPALAQVVEPTCDADQGKPFPSTFDGCEALEKQIQDPSRFMKPEGFRLDEYEALLAKFFEKYCHRNTAAGWVRDKRVRDTGPYVTSLRKDGTWRDGKNDGTHLPVVIWYSPRMLDWLKQNRSGASAAQAPSEPAPPGAIMVKEMYPAPAASCMRVPPERLKPPASTGLVFMIRDLRGSRDGWFWGAWWDGFTPDWPATGTGLPAMGYGPYCLNCHASARDNSTFADLKNVAGFPGEPNNYLSQNFTFENALTPAESAPKSKAPASPAEVPAATQGLHRAILERSDDQVRPAGAASADYPPAFLARYPRTDPPTQSSVKPLPSQSYDHVWMPGDGPSARSQFVTSDQCIGCHDAGSTGLQFDMSAPPPPGNRDHLLNLSPYGTWRSSPMGLGGRDPVFFAQLASETETFHPQHSVEIQDTCLGCHGVQGQRQHAIDALEKRDECSPMLRAYVDAVPFPPDPLAPYGALARDGIACSACHHMALTQAQIDPVRGAPQNRCVEQRQKLLNPDFTGFARTFTGSFFVGPPDELLGPFSDPKTKPMEHALGIRPVASPAVRSSELCGTCHTVHLPVYGARGAMLGRVYEQTTYPEWAFSAFRTGTLAGGEPLPSGAGKLAASCQDCHMPSRDAKGAPLQSKIASIQELRNFPATENTLPAQDIDLAVRPGFAEHTLVGLNVFLVRMARQFPNVLGIPTSDPMLYPSMDPLQRTEQAMLAQAASGTATLEAKAKLVRGGKAKQPKVVAELTVGSAVGHKLPSGVGFRRAFLELSVLDASQQPLWTSGRTDANGLIVDERGQPVAGERLWQDDCSARLDGNPHQPHYEKITRQDQAQIYQELVTAPAPVPDPKCGRDATPGGQITTSFLSICGDLKDNRILPRGFLDLKQRSAIARALGAGPELAEQTGPVGVGKDPDYREGGRDTLVYEIDLPEGSAPASVQATLWYQAIPPFFLQDRFCTSKSPDTDRLYYLAGHLDAHDPSDKTWKLAITTTGAVALR